MEGKKMTARRIHLLTVALMALALVTLLTSAALAGRYRIVLETEKHNAIKLSTTVRSGDTTASGGKYTEYPVKRPHATSENDSIKGDGGYVLFKVKIPESGNWIVWVRGWWYDGCGNSYFLIVDDKPPQTVGQDATYRVWKWRKASQPYALPAGTHTFKLQNREDGARADQILITNDARYKPVRAMTETPEYRVTE
jgi:hypothetical protein